MNHDTKSGKIIFPNHGSQEIGKGLEKKILKDAGLIKRDNYEDNKEKN